MSRLSPNRLTVRKLDALKADGCYADGGNLWLTVAGASRSWSFRYLSPVSRRRREMGLGSQHSVGLADARKAAAAARKLVSDGIDPLDQRKRDQEEARRLTVVTFETVAGRYITDRKSGWQDPRSAPVWTSSLERLAYPFIGQKAVRDVTTDDILAILRPIWTTTTETADRLRGRLERILDYARTQGWSEGENPARWKGHLAHILPKPSTVAKVEHHAAVPWQDIGPVMTKLATAGGVSALAVRFACLTAARSGEVRGARWQEMDLIANVWTVPAERMKAKKEHRVPLSAATLAVLQRARKLGDAPDALVFPGARAGRPLSDVALSKALHVAAGTKAVTVHGLRSTFRDWVAEATDYPRDVAEMALAHAIGDKVEAAYRRGDLFEKRRALMQDWAGSTLRQRVS